MGRRTFDRSTSGVGKLIDMKTGRPVRKPSVPILCDRIRFYRERLGMEQKILAQRLGISGNAISNWENGRARPDVNLLPLICEILHITMYELFDMEDPIGRYTPGEQQHLNRYRRLSDGHRHAVDLMTDTLLQVESAENGPAIRVLRGFERSLAAGIGDPGEFDDEGEPVFLYASRQTNRADYVFKVNGDSMEPDYRHGDRVLVQRTPAGPDLKYGEIGAFLVGNETYIKIYREDGLHSLNPAYKPLHFADTDRVYLIGRVIGKLQESDLPSRDEAARYAALHPELLSKGGGAG